MAKTSGTNSFSRWAVFFVAMIMSIVLITVGALLMFVDLTGVPAYTYFGAGVVMLAASLWILGPLPSRNWVASLGLLGLGIYCIARAGGLISSPRLAHLVGLGCWVGAGLLFYIAQPGEPPEPGSHASATQTPKDIS